MENIAVILVSPRYPENIGAAARACKNFGVRELVVVAPERWDEEAVLKMATHEAAEVARNLTIFKNLKEALKPYGYIVGTTARLGRHRRVLETPRDIAPRLAELSQQNKVALLFGPEHRGLSNEELFYCHTAITIPTAEFPSLNLAQAVVVVLYELFTSGKTTGLARPRRATFAETEAMYGHLEELFDHIGFIPKDTRQVYLTNIRRFLGRLDLTAQEVQIIRGFCRQMLWALNKKSSAPKDQDHCR
ncbi:RNA methyltransferase [Thermosulfuriphilus sp.]